MLRSTICLSVLATLICACPKPTPPARAPIDAKPPATKFDRLDRAAFNQAAAERAQAVFWREDTDGDRTIDPDEIAHVWGLDAEDTNPWVTDGRFTSAFREAYRQIVTAAQPAVKGQQALRRAAVLAELRQGRPTLIYSDFRQAPAEDVAILRNIMDAAEIIEQLFAVQNGVLELKGELVADDPASRALFYRNQGPRCVAPQTERDDNCSAVPSFARPLSGLYPVALQTDGFCERLAQRKDARTLLSPFTVVRGQPDALTVQGYHEAFAPLMNAVAEKLTAAAGAIRDPKEAPFKAYLTAAAKAFVTNDWEPADEAWSRMNAENSRWYLRIGPDEVYFDPCNRKAGFHVSFARINPDSLRWQAKLDPVKQDMEAVLAKLAGPSYQARRVTFKLPDFIDIVLNAGDSRAPLGATVGQSLPNWGPVANESRGRTVAMTNLYQDPDSQADLRKQAESVLCPDTAALVSTDADASLVGTLLHEAAHNLGPSHEYRVGQKTAAEIFGGPMASTLEELKAQTAALFFTEWLADRDVLDADLAAKARIRDLLWAFGHISRGLYTSDGKPKPYSQLAAIQVGYMVDARALQWRPNTPAASGDQGCMSLDLKIWPDAVEKLMARVMRLKAKGDVNDASGLIRTYVDMKGSEEKKALLATISERWRRAPKASFVYSIALP